MTKLIHKIEVILKISYFLIWQVPKCITCPSGYECVNSTQPPAACLLGTYSTGGNSTCLSCPEGKQCLDPSQVPTNCPIGTYSLSVSYVFDYLQQKSTKFSRMFFVSVFRKPADFEDWHYLFPEIWLVHHMPEIINFLNRL